MQTKTAGVFDVTLMSTRTTTGTGSMANYLSQTGNVLVIAKFSLVYKGTGTQTVDLLFFKAEADGQKATVTADGTSTPLEGVFMANSSLSAQDARQLGVTLPGESLVGEVGFIVSEGWKSMTITFRNGGESASFTVNS